MVGWFFLIISLFVSIFAIIRWILSKSIVSVPDKVILVTGCDAGFGNLLVRRLDSINCVTFATCLNKDCAENLNKVTSNHCHPLVLDVTNKQHIDNVFTEIKNYCIQHKTSLWAIVNNAGLGGGGYFECTSNLMIDQIIMVNLLGTIHITHKFLPLMKGRKELSDNPNKLNDQKMFFSEHNSKWNYWKRIFFNSSNGGRIINISSLAGTVSNKFLTVFGASKSGINGFSNNLRLEVTPHFGIWVSTIEPGFFKTHLIDKGSFKSDPHISSNSQNQELLLAYGGEETIKKEFLRTYETIYKIASPSLNEVINSIEHALFSKAPYRHYLINWRTGFFKFIFYLPDVITDWINYIIQGIIRF